MTGRLPGVGAGAALAAVLALPAPAQEVTWERVRGDVWRIDGAIDVIVAQAGPEGLLMVDTGYPFAEEGVRAALRAVAGSDRPEWLLNTHAHHAFANHLYGAEAHVVAHRNVGRRLASGYLMAGTLVPPAQAAGRPDLVFSDSLRLRMNGEDVSVIHLPGAHTDGDAVVVFHGSGVVAAGDLVVPHMPWISVDEHGSVEGLLSALDRLLDLVPEDALLVPGHDPVTLRKDDLRAFRAMIAGAADTVRARMAAGMSLRRMQTLGLPHLAGWRGDVPEALFIESLFRSLRTARPSPDAPTLAFVDGLWWDGSGFTPGTRYSVEGVLTSDAPARVDRTVDLEGGYVVPAFGDAHTHRLGDPGSLEAEGAAFLADGTFYAMVQDPLHPVGDAHRAFSRRVDAPDVAYTQGVVTPSWGVIPDFYASMAAAGRFGEGASLAALDGELLFRIDTEDDLAAAWPALRAANDRFVKVVVAFSEELPARVADPEAYGTDLPRSSARPGVTEGVLRALVERAHEAGLEVSAHIETAADFRLAVDAGVDWIAHMPASWQVGAGTGSGADETAPWLLSAEDARAARAAGTTVVTTLAPWSADDPRAATFRRIHAHNLEILAGAGVTLALGSDLANGTAVDEALHLRSLDVLTDAQLFRLLAVQTPRAIFPELRIGHLLDGWEATFLVLGGDPTEELDRIRDVRLAVKRGRVLPATR